MHRLPPLWTVDLVALSPASRVSHVTALSADVQTKAVRYDWLRRGTQRRLVGLRPPAVVGAGIVHRPVLRELATTVDRPVRIAIQRRSRTRWRLSPPPPRVITGILLEPPGIFQRTGRGAGW